MKQLTYKLMTLLVVLSLFFVLPGCNIFGVSEDQAKENLVAAGYELEVLDGATYCNSDQNQFNLFETDLVTYIHATKGDDEIYLFYFWSIDDASFNYGFMSMRGLRSGQSNELVYFGTKQAVKDCGL